MVFCTEFLWMGGGLESRVYGAHGAVHGMMGVCTRNMSS